MFGGLHHPKNQWNEKENDASGRNAEVTEPKWPAHRATMAILWSVSMI